ncbi:MAG: glycosyltransferase [Patescibacteria group bacterium]
MKILQVVPYFYPAWSYGGPAKLVYDLSNEIVKNKHKITVYTSDCFDKEQRMPAAKKIKKTKNLKIHYFANLSNYLAFNYHMFFTPKLFVRAVGEIKSFDILHLHDFFTLQHVWICFLAKIYKKPYIISVHGTLEKMDLAKKIFYFLFGKLMLSGAKKLIASSDNEENTLKKLGFNSEKILRIGNGVDPQEFETKMSKMQARTKLSLPKDKIIFTFLGRISQLKGIDILIEAIKRIKIANVFFVIAGSDSGYIDELKYQIKKYNLSKKVLLKGVCFGKEKSLLFKASDVFIYPSYLEGFSIGILEAASVGLPLIISNKCNFNELATHNAALIVTPKSKNLGVAINKLAKNESLRKSLGKNVKKIVANKYSIEGITKQLLESYSDS